MTSFFLNLLINIRLELADQDGRLAREKEGSIDTCILCILSRFYLDTRAIIVVDTSILCTTLFI
jgi:hypothetical protein